LSKSDNFTIGMRDQLRGKIQAQIFGSYTLGYTKNNTNGAFSLPVNSYDMTSEWGRSPQDTRHRFNTGMQIRMPWNVSTTTQVNWNSSRPYNITTGQDCNADNSINDRPTDAALAVYQNNLSAWTAAGSNPTNFAGMVLSTNYCAIPGKVIPRNTGKGPGQFNVTLNFQKTVRLKSAEATPTNRAGNGGGVNGVNNFVEPQRGGGGGGNFGGGNGNFNGGNGNFNGNNNPNFNGQRGNNPNYQGGNRGNNNGNFNQNGNGKTVTFQFQIQNLLNNTQLNGYSGTMTSTFFGRASSARQPRQVEAGLRFNF
jgi:hypothetical protein